MSAFLCIATLLKSNVPKEHIIKFLKKVESDCLRQKLKLAKIYSGVSSKTKNQLIEMIIYGFMCDKIKDMGSIHDFDKNKFNALINKCNIVQNELVGYGNYNKNKRALI